MMVRWDVPSWQGFPWRVKLIKYIMWVEMISAGEIEVSEERVRFVTKAEDLGYKGGEEGEWKSEKGDDEVRIGVDY